MQHVSASLLAQLTNLLFFDLFCSHLASFQNKTLSTKFSQDDPQGSTWCPVWAQKWWSGNAVRICLPLMTNLISAHFLFILITSLKKMDSENLSFHIFEDVWLKFCRLRDHRHSAGVTLILARLTSIFTVWCNWKQWNFSPLPSWIKQATGWEGFLTGTRKNLYYSWGNSPYFLIKTGRIQFKLSKFFCTFNNNFIEDINTPSSPPEASEPLRIPVRLAQDHRRAERIEFLSSLSKNQ